MHKVFIDSDIFIDIFAHRNPFYNSAAKVLTLIDQKKILGFTSPIVFTNIHYILSKLTTKELALNNLRKLKSIIQIISINDKTIELALDSNFIDFEDAIQYHTAKSKDVGFIITRNKKDYQKSIIPVCNAEEYLLIWTLENQK
ncbi:MAG: PIN domain-containing protein [bacterium]